MEIKVYNGDPQDIWAIVNTGGQEITELALSKTADQLMDLALAEYPDNPTLLDQFWAITWKPLDERRFIMFLRPDSRCGRTSMRAIQHIPSPEIPRTLTIRQAVAACTL
jgi:hypothetical protein